MEFVFSFWYIVVAVLVVASVACLVVFFLMDKKDKVLIDEFIASNEVQEAEQEDNKSNK